MYPILISYGHAKLASFGFLYNVVVAVCAIVLSLEFERQKWPVPEVPFFLRWLPASLRGSIWFAGAWISASFMGVGLLGARLLFSVSHTLTVASEQHLPFSQWPHVFNSSCYDSMWFGGFLLCVLWSVYIARLSRLQYLKFLDLAVLLSVLGQVPGRLACFLGGCCYGKPTTLPWGIAYDSAFSLLEFPRGTRLHPSQLYEMAVAAILFAYMWRKRSGNTFDGQTTIRYFIWGGLARFVTEFFRADTPRGLIWPWMSVSQGIGLGLAAVGIILHLYLSRKTSTAANPKAYPA